MKNECLQRSSILSSSEGNTAHIKNKNGYTNTHKCTKCCDLILRLEPKGINIVDILSS